MGPYEQKIKEHLLKKQLEEAIVAREKSMIQPDEEAKGLVDHKAERKLGVHKSISQTVDEHVNKFQANTFSSQDSYDVRVDKFGNLVDTFGNPIVQAIHPPIPNVDILDALKLKSDPVNHPPHYKKHPSGIECITITREMNFNLGNAVKYIWRSGEKGNVIQDLEKAIWYLKDEIKRLTPP